MGWNFFICNNSLILLHASIIYRWWDEALFNSTVSTYYPVNESPSVCSIHLSVEKQNCSVYVHCVGGTAAATPPPFRPGNLALCGSHPLVTPYYCRLGICCFLFIVCLLYFSINCVFFVFLQYFDTVGLVFWVLTCKNCRRYNLYCVSGDIKPWDQSINHVHSDCVTVTVIRHINRAAFSLRHCRQMPLA